MIEEILVSTISYLKIRDEILVPWSAVFCEIIDEI